MQQNETDVLTFDWQPVFLALGRGQSAVKPDPIQLASVVARPPLYCVVVSTSCSFDVLRCVQTGRDAVPPDDSTLISMAVFTLHAAPRGKSICLARTPVQFALRRSHISGDLCLFSEFVVQCMTSVVLL